MRYVKLKTSTSVLVRPVDKIVLLEEAPTAKDDKQYTNILLVIAWTMNTVEHFIQV